MSDIDEDAGRALVAALETLRRGGHDPRDATDALFAAVSKHRAAMWNGMPR